MMIIENKEANNENEHTKLNKTTTNNNNNNLVNINSNSNQYTNNNNNNNNTNNSNHSNTNIINNLNTNGNSNNNNNISSKYDNGNIINNNNNNTNINNTSTSNETTNISNSSLVNINTNTNNLNSNSNNNNYLDQCDMTSLEILNKCHLELFPKTEPHCDDQNYLKFTSKLPTLSGEYVRYIGPSGKQNDDILMLTNFRLFQLIHDCTSFINVPIMLIESIEVKEIIYIYIYLKNAKTIRLTFNSTEKTTLWWNRLNSIVNFSYKLEDLFAFAFYSWLTNENSVDNLDDLNEVKCHFSKNEQTNLISKEFKRMKFDSKLWRLSEVNSKFELCATYPEQIIVPRSISDEQLKKVASFRSSKRFPAVVWRSKKNGAVLARSSQPSVGLWARRLNEDELLLRAIAEASSTNSSSSSSSSSSPSSSLTTNATETNSLLLIIDARFNSVALANRVKGGGYEYSEYYTNCEIQFMNLENIHVIRSSFQQLRLLCQLINDNKSILSQLEGTKWLHHISGILKAAYTVTNAIDQGGKPVLIHCSDGWDRTPQILALAKILLDPYYRTINGFRTLIEVDWLMFGHKFAQRNGHSSNHNDVNERCPVFLQWLDCVYQITRQFPSAFEFNETYLLKLCYHSYSCLFGTFLCDSMIDRVNLHIDERTFSIWSYLNDKNQEIINHLYDDSFDEVLYPMYEIINLQLWQKLFCESEITYLVKVERQENQNFNDSVDGIYCGSSPPEHQLKQIIHDDLDPPGIYSNSNSNIHKQQQNNNNFLKVGANKANMPIYKTRSFDDINKLQLQLAHQQQHNQQQQSQLNGQHPKSKDDMMMSGSDSLDQHSSVSSNSTNFENLMNNLKLNNHHHNNHNSSYASDDVNNLSIECNSHICVNANNSNSNSSYSNSNNHNHNNGDPIPTRRCSEPNLLLDALNSASPKIFTNSSFFSSNNNVTANANVGPNRADPPSTLTSTSSEQQNDDSASQPGDPYTNEDDVENEGENVANTGNDQPNKYELVYDLEIAYQSNQGTTTPTTTTTITAANHIKMKESGGTSLLLMQNSTDTLVDETLQLSRKMSNAGTETETKQQQTGPDLYKDMLDGKLQPSTTNEPQQQQQQLHVVTSSESSTSSTIPSPNMSTNDFKLSKCVVSNSISTSTSGLMDFIESNNKHNPLQQHHHHHHHHQQPHHILQETNETLKLLNSCIYNGNDVLFNNYNLYCNNLNNINNKTVRKSTNNNNFNNNSNYNGKSASNRKTSNSIPIKNKNLNESSVKKRKKTIKDMIDVDGLTRIQDRTFRKIVERDEKYKKEITVLREQINKCKFILNKLASSNPVWHETPTDFSPNDISEHSQSDENQSNSFSIGNDSVCSSWDEIDESDYKLAPWVPDYYVTHCQSCNEKFSYRLRKHHCRHCGQVFCYKCADNFYPIPNLNLTIPVRVCHSCKLVIEKQQLQANGNSKSCSSNAINGNGFHHYQPILNHQKPHMGYQQQHQHQQQYQQQNHSPSQLIFSSTPPQQNDPFFSPNSISTTASQIANNHHHHHPNHPHHILHNSKPKLLNNNPTNIGSRCNQSIDSSKFKKNENSSQKVSV